MYRAPRILVPLVGVVALLAACRGDASAPSAGVPSPLPTITRSPQGGPVTGGGSTGGASQGGGTGGQGGASGWDHPATADDLQVYALATEDLTTVTAQLDTVRGTLSTMASDAAAGDVQGVVAGAHLALDQAHTLSTRASQAAARQRTLGPADPDLKHVRADAMDAFGLTASYAQSVVDLADAATSADASELAFVISRQKELAKTADGLITSYDALGSELTSWSAAHPAEAAKAIRRYR